MNFKTRYLLLALLIAGVTFCYVQFNPVAEPVHLRVLGASDCCSLPCRSAVGSG